MATLKQASMLKAAGLSYQTLRNFHLNPIACGIKKWRVQNKLFANPNEFGPLTNLPDYSFKDGRPVPYGMHQMRRIDEQRANLVRIKTLVSEIDYAVERHKERLRSAEEEKQNILDRKLKEKGDKLLPAGSETLKLVDGKSEETDRGLSAGECKDNS